MTDQNPIGAPAPPTHAPWFRRSPIVERPGPATSERLAVTLVLDLRAMEDPAAGPPTTLEPPGGRGTAPPPDHPRISHREYGHRVGIFRLLSRCQDRGIRPTVVLDVLTAEHYPAVVDAVRTAGAEIIAGGLSAGRAITATLPEEVERRLVETSLHRLEQVLGQRPRGWFGAEHGESPRTPAILAESGLEFLLDWGNDEQPVPLEGAPPLWSVPVSWELSDLAALYHRQVLPWTYVTSVIDAVEQMVVESRTQPRVLALHWHPWLIGQPFRMATLEPLLDRLAAPDLTVTTPGGILERWRGPTPAGS